MTKQIITIHVETDINPSQLLDLALEFALEFGKDVEGATDEPCVVDEELTSVTDAPEEEE